MKKFQRPDGNPVPHVHVAEITTPQLIIYLCLALCAFALFFGLGVITGRLDPSYKDTGEKVEITEQGGTEMYSVPVADGDNAASGKTSDKDTAGGAQRTPETPKPRNPYMTAEPGLTSLEPLNANISKSIQIEAPSKTPTPATKTEGEQSTPSILPKIDGSDAAKSSEQKSPPVAAATPATTVNTTVPSSTGSPVPVQPAVSPTTATPDSPVSSPAPPASGTPVVKSETALSPSGSPPSKPSGASPETPGETTPSAKPAEIPLLTPLTPEEPPVKDLPMEPLSSEPNVIPAAPSAGTGQYGIQLVAFTESDRRTRAENLHQKLKKDTGLNVQVLPSSDGSIYRVIVGGFANKESASHALTEVRAKTGFPQAFVKAL